MNGRLRLGTDVVLVENGQYLTPTAAAFWRLMKAAAAKDGVNLSINEGYRTYERQVYYRNLYLSGQGNPAGIPGTSKHGLGLAVDVFLNPGVFEWLTKNAATYGFTWTQGRADNEKWHWVFDGTPRIAALPNPIILEDDMKPQNFYDESTHVKGKAVAGSAYMTLWPSGAITHTPRVIPTPKGTAEKAVQLSSLYGKHKPLSHDLYEQIIADHA